MQAIYTSCWLSPIDASLLSMSEIQVNNLLQMYILIDQPSKRVVCRISYTHTIGRCITYLPWCRRLRVVVDLDAFHCRVCVVAGNVQARGGQVESVWGASAVWLVLSCAVLDL